jgi:hypothetical protein
MSKPQAPQISPASLTGQPMLRQKPQALVTRHPIPEKDEFGSAIEQLSQNRHAYQQSLNQQQEILRQLPEKLSDYLILQQYASIKREDAFYELKKALYETTHKLVLLHQDYERLQTFLAQLCLSYNPENIKSKARKFVVFQGKNITGEEQAVVGDGWCTLYAIGVKDPKAALDELKAQLKQPKIVNYLRNAIYNNYHASKSGIERFEMKDKKDAQGKIIVTEIERLDKACQVDDISKQFEANKVFMAYLEDESVQAAYLDSLKENKYTNANIAEAYLALTEKRLALVADYGDANGRLANLSADDIDLLDPATLCLIYLPRETQSLAHYNIFKLNLSKEETKKVEGSLISPTSKLSSQSTSFTYFKPSDSTKPVWPSVPIETLSQQEPVEKIRELLQEFEGNEIKEILIHAFRTPPTFDQVREHLTFLRSSLLKAANTLVSDEIKKDTKRLDELLALLFKVPITSATVIEKANIFVDSYEFALDYKSVLAIGNIDTERKDFSMI